MGSGANMDRVPDPPERDFGLPRLLFVGKQFARKGGENLLKAFRLVHAQRPDAELWLVGPRRLEEEHAGVRWFGRIDRSTPEGDAEMHRLYREATAFVMPSLYEPFGIVFLEAMAYRLPCIGGACCAMPEIIEDGVTGYVAPYDVEQLAERLLAVINDPEQARAMGEAGYRRFRERYGWDNVAARTVSAVAGRPDAR